MQGHAETAEFVDEALAFHAPFFQVRWGIFRFSRAGENDVGDFEITDRAGEVRGFAVELAAEQE